MPLKVGQERNAIYCHSGYGPTFGRGHDLNIPNKPNSNMGYVGLNHTYQCPMGQNANTFLTGNQSFTVSEMEVFWFWQVRSLYLVTELEYDLQAITHQLPFLIVDQ